MKTFLCLQCLALAAGTAAYVHTGPLGYKMPRAAMSHPLRGASMMAAASVERVSSCLLTSQVFDADRSPPAHYFLQESDASEATQAIMALVEDGSWSNCKAVRKLVTLVRRPLFVKALSLTSPPRVLIGRLQDKPELGATEAHCVPHSPIPSGPPWKHMFLLQKESAYVHLLSAQPSCISVISMCIRRAGQFGTLSWSTSNARHLSHAMQRASRNHPQPR